MFNEILTLSVYSFGFMSLVLIDYVLGNGFVDLFQRIFCKFVCFVRKTIRDDQLEVAGNDSVSSLSYLLTEILVLGISSAFLNHMHKLFMRCGDRIGELLKDSREKLRQTNENLEILRRRRVEQTPRENSYLDEEPQEIKPYKLEVPILHMAIIDTLGTTRSQPERGDAGDTINITDSTLLSVTSLLDDDFESIATSEGNESIEKSIAEFKDRYLWDLVEEDE